LSFSYIIRLEIHQEIMGE